MARWTAERYAAALQLLNELEDVAYNNPSERWRSLLPELRGVAENDEYLTWLADVLEETLGWLTGDYFDRGVKKELCQVPLHDDDWLTELSSHDVFDGRGASKTSQRIETFVHGGVTMAHLPRAWFGEARAYVRELAGDGEERTPSVLDGLLPEQRRIVDALKALEAEGFDEQRPATREQVCGKADVKVRQGRDHIKGLIALGIVEDRKPKQGIWLKRTPDGYPETG